MSAHSAPELELDTRTLEAFDAVFNNSLVSYSDTYIQLYLLYNTDILRINATTLYQVTLTDKCIYLSFFFQLLYRMVF